jgi:beta-galactosidase
MKDTQRLLLVCLMVLSGVMTVMGQESISLAGNWAFRLDPDNRGLKEKWFADELPDRVKLPGSLDEQGIGTLFSKAERGRLTPQTTFVGKAWYQKEVNIPENWKGKSITLFLERACWETNLYVDGIPAGSENSLSIPHEYDLSDLLTPGKHSLSIYVDNTVKINIGHTFGNMLWPHALSAETQTNWNGIIGEMRISARPLVHLGKIQIYPNFTNSITRVTVSILNGSGHPVSGQLDFSVTPDGGFSGPHEFTLNGMDTIIEVKIPFGESPGYWDEFSPELYDLKVILSTGPESDTSSVKYALRDFQASGQHFELNGRRIYLRGKACSAVFPLTGFPPMSLEEWERIFRIYLDYGLNHVRFHSWCPPEAAFIAADKMGLILHIEPPLWDGYGQVGSIPERAAFILAETDRIVETYGNHPSFCLMSLGNELGDGKDPYLAYLLNYLQKKDPRHLYTSTTHPPGRERKDDYFAGAGTEAGICRGVKPFGDFREALQDLERPLITHELGQPAMYPNFREIPKYTGHLKPLYLDIFKESLREHHMLDMAEKFRMASGALLVEIYKENIEAQLRTPNSAGFQVLDIQDYPGHGMATIGILDVFLDSKGLVTAEQFRRFCNPTVPLIRMPGFTYTSDDTLKADAEIAHYGSDDLPDQVVNWRVLDKSGRALKSGSLGPVNIPTGSSTAIGSFEMSFNHINDASQLSIELSIPGTEIGNSWKCWVYPSDPDIEIPDSITVSSTWNDETREILSAGGRVLIIPEQGVLENTEKSRWDPVLWSYQLFKQPKMMGILCDPEHPSLEEFPTDFHSDWQWRDLLDQSEALVLNDTPAGFRPIIQFIPDFNSNLRLSALLEARVGRGRLMVCNIDLLDNTEHKHTADQLFHSILAYMQSIYFQPLQELNMSMVDDLLKIAEPVENQSNKPDAKSASLNIRAATKSVVGVPDPWNARKLMDDIISQHEGYDYRVQGKYWRDASHSAWFEKHLIITVSCPTNFKGSFYIHLHDINDHGRAAALFFCGRDHGPLPRYDKDGVWLKFPVSPAMAKSGELIFDARATEGPNVTVSQIILIPDRLSNH